ncbi:MAG: AmmeMemoRadiSam system protein B [Dictyoglomus sp.]
MKRRLPYVAGYFYPEKERELTLLLKEFIQQVPKKTPVWACIVPHAGYIYSGKVAGKVYSSIEIPDTVILLGPNHNGLGNPAAIFKEGIWSTPLGDVEIDNELANKIFKYSSHLKDDPSAHQPEHSLEVQIPFLQFLKSKIRIVPITISNYKFEVLSDLGIAISKAIAENNQEVMIIASSDFSHYEPHEIAKQKDLYAIEAILNLDEKEFIDRVIKEDISICGVGPIVVTIIAVKLLGGISGKLLDYKTSGDVTKDFSQVVGYAGIIFPK